MVLISVFVISFISEKRGQISDLEKERQSVYNRNRHKKSEELNAQAREISARIKPLRAELSLAKAVLEKTHSGGEPMGSFRSNIVSRNQPAKFNHKGEKYLYAVHALYFTILNFEAVIEAERQAETAVIIENKERRHAR